MTVRPWFDHYDAGVARTLAPYPEQTLLDLLAENARAHPEHPITYMKGRVMSYAELDRLSDACAAAFAALGVRPGDRVACANWTGGYAERMVAKEWKSVRLAAGIAFEPAATILHNYGTAYCALVERARPQRGETVFITGAAGGVGLAAVDLARHFGLRVIAGVGSDDKAALVRAYGAGDVINYRSEDLRERIKSITNGDGVDICFDNVGGTVFEQMARLMKWGGRLMPIGFTSGQIPSMPMNLPLLKNYSIVGVFAAVWAEKFPEQAVRMHDTLARLLEEGKIRPHVDRILPLEQFKDAMHAVANRTVQGRIVLKTK